MPLNSVTFHQNSKIKQFNMEEFCFLLKEKKQWCKAKKTDISPFYLSVES